MHRDGKRRVELLNKSIKEIEEGIWELEKGDDDMSVDPKALQYNKYFIQFHECCIKQNT